MSEDPQNTTQAPEPSEEGEAPTQALRPPPRVLLGALLASTLLHLSPLLTMLSLNLTPDTDVEMEWMGDFEDLQGVGHGSDGRWARARDIAAPPDTQDQDTPSEEPPPEPEPPPKEEAPPEEEPEEPAPPEEPEPREVAAAKKTPKPDTTPPAKPESTPKEAPEPEESPTPDTSTGAAAAQAQGLPGLERGGPSNLPTLKNYAPGNARFTALIQFDELRGAPYEESVRKLVRLVPDYRILLDGSETDPIAAFDALFSASADPRYLQETFLAVRHSLGEAGIKEALAARYVDEITWTTYGGYPIRAMVPESSAYRDPRKILLPSEDLAIVTRPEWLGMLTEDQPADSPLRAPTEGTQPLKDLKDLPAMTMVQGLQRIEEAADPGTLAIVSLSGLRFYVPGYGRLPRFESARIALTNVAEPTVTIDLQFRGEAPATNFTKACPRLKREILGAIPGATFIGLPTYINRLTCRVEGTYVTVDATYTTQEFGRLLRLITPFMPSPPALRDLPAPPPPEPPPSLAAPDADLGPAISNEMGQPTAPDMDGVTGPDSGSDAAAETPPQPQGDTTAPTPPAASARDAASTDSPDAPLAQDPAFIDRNATDMDAQTPSP